MDKHKIVEKFRIPKIQSKIGKAFLVLMSIMLVLTVISRASASFTVAQVQVEQPAPRKLDYEIVGDGKVEQSREKAILTVPDVLVDEICVKKGQTVHKGDILAKLQIKSLEEKMKTMEDEMATLRLQNDGLQAAKNQTEAQELRDLKAARKQEIQELQAAIKEARTAYNLAKEQEETERVQAARVLEDAKKEPEKDISLETIQLELGQKSRQLEALKKLKQAGSNKEGIDEEIQSLEDEIAVLQLQSQSLLADEEKREQESQTAQRRAQEDYNRTIEKNKKLVKDAKKSLENAKKDLRNYKKDNRRDPVNSENSEGNYTLKSNLILLQEKQVQWEKFEEIKEAGGKIKALEDGILTDIKLEVGQMTTDTAAFFFSSSSDEMRYVATITKEAAANVAVGDEVTLETASQKYEGLTITSMEEDDNDSDEEGEAGMVKVIVIISDGSLKIGDRATMKVVKHSKEYSVTVPLTAIHTKNGKDFVYVMEEEDTVLGKQYVARPVEVNIVEKNNTYAALEDGLLTEDSNIVIDSTISLNAGDRIRLQAK